MNTDILWRHRRIRQTAVCVLIVLGVVACNQSEKTAGIDGSGARIYAEGPIQSFGSIVLNSVHYEIDSAEIRVNGELATEQDLELGQVVMVDAHVDAQGTTIAESVEFEANLRGPVEEVDVDEGVVIVLSQRVRIGPETVLVAGGIADLNPGDVVEVSALDGADGTLDATRIALAPAGAELRIVGRVDDLDLGNFRFSIGDLIIDYAGAGLIDGFPTGGPREGDRVIATGDSLVDERLIATRLQWVDTSLSDRAGHEAEVEGRITRFVSAGDFDVAGVPAMADVSTQYEGGTSSDLRLDLKIQIEGEIDDDGRIVADKIEIKDGG